MENKDLMEREAARTRPPPKDPSAVAPKKTPLRPKTKNLSLSIKIDRLSALGHAASTDFDCIVLAFLPSIEAQCIYK